MDAIIYMMHVQLSFFRYHDNNQVKDFLSCLDKDKLVGTVSFLNLAMDPMLVALD
ncbi:uncharacterized protein LOC143039470 [Oratosquilla oratoria]|uniref:uncharacterized protein LOC143039470 n=1 Tax=Oratosquilla oratoria TaxID=337810 RepID=UPI003F7757A8